MIAKRVRAVFGVGRDPSLTAHPSLPGPTCCHKCFPALHVSLHLSESQQHSNSGAREQGVPLCVLRGADREGDTARVGHVGRLPAPYSAEFMPCGRGSFLLCCWQPGKEEVTRVLPLVLAKIRAVVEDSPGSVSPVGSG